MSLTTKLALTMLLPALVALAVSVATRLPREAQLFVSDMQRDHEAAGAALVAAVEDVWEEDGEERALELLQDATYGGMRVRHLTLPQLREIQGINDERSLSRLQRGLPVSRIEQSEGRVDEIATYVPLRPLGAMEGALRFRESLGMREAYLSGTLLRTVQLSVIVALLAAFAAWRLGARLFSDPVERLLAHARRIGDGQLGSESYPARSDELGLLGHEMNRMVERLKSAREDSEQQNLRRLDTLEQLRHAERLTTVGKLASGVAHELGTPLHVVIARAKRIQKREPEGETAHDAESIEREGQRMSRLIQQLLDFSRPREPHKEPVELVTLARDTTTLLRPIAEARKVSLEVESLGEGSIEGDYDALVQVLTNLVMNSIQATEPGRVVKVAVKEPIPLEQDGATRIYARVAVSDQGHGIPDAMRQRIFEPFFTTREVGEGTGLGLSVAWGIVREHGGFIEVWSEPDRGSRFTVHLPLPERGARHEPASAA